MRKLFLIAGVTFFIVLTLFLVAGIIRKANAYSTISKSIVKLPDFSFITLSNDTLSSSDIRKGPLLIIHFHPECEHCKYEINDIMKSELPSLNCRVLLITNASPDSVNAFIKRNSIEISPPFTILLDTGYHFSEIFGSKAIPSNHIYNHNLELVKVLKGEYKTETIIKYLVDCEKY